jgi:23S rRNA pseudouridine1911/1915/1917 synthase
VRAGQHIRVRPAPPPPSAAEPEDIPLVVLYEDEHLVVIDKPAGLVVHPAAGHAGGTLVNALLHRFGALPGEDAARPGIVHRLDALTSGVMVVARTAAAREGLMRSFAAHDIERAYVGIALGAPPAKITYDTPYGRHPRDRKRFSTKVRSEKRAVTHVEVLERLHGAALVRCTLETGRTHQIRVHLAEHGFPLLGDPIYGRRAKDERLRAAADSLGRQALHAAVLGFVHPVTGVSLRFATDPPADFAAALAGLRDQAR